MQKRLPYGEIGHWMGIALLMAAGAGSFAIAVLDLFGLEYVLYGKSFVEEPRLSIILSVVGLLALTLGWERATTLRRLAADVPALRDTVEVIRNRQTSNTSYYYDAPDALFSAIDSVLSKVKPPSIIRHLHIQVDPDPHTMASNSAIDFFIAERFRRYVQESRPGNWEVRELYSIQRLSRLDFIVARCNEWTAARQWTVKAWPTKSTLPNLSPFVIGENDAFLVLGDPTSQHASKGIHISGKESVSLLAEYFDSIFYKQDLNQTRVYLLHEHGYTLDRNIDNLRQFMERKRFDP